MDLADFSSGSIEPSFWKAWRTDLSGDPDVVSTGSLRRRRSQRLHSRIGTYKCKWQADPLGVEAGLVRAAATTAVVWLDGAGVDVGGGASAEAASAGGGLVADVAAGGLVATSAGGALKMEAGLPWSFLTGTGLDLVAPAAAADGVNT